MFMNRHRNSTLLIQCHKEIPDFNYDLSVDWAVELLNNGLVTENLNMLASFSKPVDSSEIKPYVAAVLKDLDLAEKEGDEAKYSIIQNYLLEILENRSIRKNLRQLYDICIRNDYGFGLMPFYLLYHAWSELEDFGANFYYEGATESNIENKIIEEAKNWLATF
jgi:hypothetical protein